VDNPGKSLVGRARELSELSAGLDEAMRGVGGHFLLVGEPGIGKTKLADELGRRAKALGFAVHWGRCWEVGGAPAFWPWIQIFRSMLRDPKCHLVASAYSRVLSRLLPELSEGERGHALELDHAQARFQLFDELWALQRAIAEQVPLLLVLDDLHAADPSSLAFLQFVVHDLRANRVVVLVTYRDRETKPVPELAETIRAITGDGTFLPLRRLDLDEVQQFLDARAGRPLAPDLAKALHQATEGNPLFVDQVFRMLAARDALQAPGTGLPLPERIRDMIKRRLGTLDAGSRALLEAGAVVGREFTRSTIAAVTESDETAMRASLDAAIDAGVLIEPMVGSYEFAHALFREALYRDLAAAARAELHRRVADALEAARAPERALAEIASHLLAALTVVGPKRALEGAMRAGRRALDSLAFEDAATVLARAIDAIDACPEDERTRGRALIMLGEALARAGVHERARKVCEGARDIARRLGDATLLAEAGLALGAEIVPGTIPVALVNLLEEAAQALPPEPTPLRARVLARLAAAQQPSLEPDQPMAIARDAVAMARAVDDDETLRVCLHMGGSALVDYAEPVERLEWDSELLRLSAEAGDLIATERAHTRLIFDYLELGRFVEADAHIRIHGELADELGMTRYQWLTLMLLSLRALADGRLEEGEELRERARRIGERTPSPELEVAYYLQAWGYAFARGEPLPYMQEVTAATAHFPGSAMMSLVTGLVECGRRGDLEGAQSLVAQIPEDSPVLTCPGVHLRFLAEAFARLHDGRRAERVYRTLQPWKDRWFSWGRVGMVVEGPVDWLLGMLAAAMDRSEDAARHFEAALDRCARLGMKPYEAITCAEYARMLARQGGQGAATLNAVVQRGHRIATELGLGGLVREFERLTGASISVPAPLAGAPVEAKAAREAASGTSSFSLVKDGELWACTSDKRSFRLKDSRGLAMLAELVLHPHREFHVLTLVGSEGADPGDAGEIIDREAIETYRSHVADLRDQLSEAESFGDRGRSDRLKRELDMVSAELARAVGLSGKGRRAGAAAERARINVQRRLRDAIRRITEQDSKLGRQLDRAVRTGTFCAYEPAEPG
jgi:tetratricopeptide (TPR) repeat protein